jgi:hypothetical protein
MDQCRVAHLVSEGVIQALEVVKIDQRQGQLAATTARTCQFPLVSLVKAPTVERAGEGVGQCGGTGVAQGLFENPNMRFGCQ